MNGRGEWTHAATPSVTLKDINAIQSEFRSRSHLETMLTSGCHSASMSERRLGEHS